MEHKAIEFGLTRKRTDFEVAEIKTSQQAYEYIRKFYFDDIDIYESAFILLLNQKNKTIGYAKISQGGISFAPVDVRLVCKYAVDSLASGVILAHNHPSGSTEPSKQDRDLTKKVREALNIFDCQLLDHLILTSENYCSMADIGLI